MADILYENGEPLAAIVMGKLVEVQEIVQCGECIFWEEQTRGCKRNPSTYRWYAKDFCSYGVR